MNNDYYVQARPAAQKGKPRSFLATLGVRDDASKAHLHPHAVEADMWGEVCGYHEGYLQKCSSKGTWQKRFFACRNGYWNYYANRG